MPDGGQLVLAGTPHAAGQYGLVVRADGQVVACPKALATGPRGGQGEGALVGCFVRGEADVAVDPMLLVSGAEVVRVCPSVMRWTRLVRRQGTFEYSLSRLLAATAAVRHRPLAF